MARQAKNNVNKFKGLEDSPAIQGIEKIYEANEEARQKRVAEALEKQQGEQATIESEQQPQVTAPASAAPAPAAPSAPSTPLLLRLHPHLRHLFPNQHQCERLARRLRTVSLSMCRWSTICRYCR